MYQATVNAVSGTKVFADGKWLTCIGNKPVKVGDRVWTDGRCVYGNYQVPQTPIVITPSNYVGIPIQIGNYLFTFRNGKFEPVGDISQGTILNDNKKNVYCLKATAANCYDNGDIYTLDATNASYISYDSYENTDDLKVPALDISISKNGKILKRVQVQDFVENTINQILQEVENLPHANGVEDGIVFEEVRDGVLYREVINTFYQINVQSYLLWSFIDDDNNWAFLYYVHVIDSKERIISAGYGGIEPLFGTIDGYAQNVGIYYVNSDETTELIHRYHILAKFTRKEGFNPGYGDINDYDYQINIESDKMNELKLPIQDNYYFKIKKIEPDENLHLLDKAKYNILPYVNYDIFSPNDSLLFSIEESIGVYFSIYQLAENIFLVGIKPTITTKSISSNRGLHICENGSLTNIVEILKVSEDDEIKQLAEKIKDSNCKNFYLRPMKNSKYWWNKIQDLTA